MFPERGIRRRAARRSPRRPAVEPTSATVAQVDSLFAKFRAEGPTAEGEEPTEAGPHAPAGEVEDGRREADEADAVRRRSSRRDAELTPLIVGRGAAPQASAGRRAERRARHPSAGRACPCHRRRSSTRKTQQIDRYLDSIGDDLEARPELAPHLSATIRTPSTSPIPVRSGRFVTRSPEASSARCGSGSPSASTRLTATTTSIDEASAIGVSRVEDATHRHRARRRVLPRLWPRCPRGASHRRTGHMDRRPERAGVPRRRGQLARR